MSSFTSPLVAKLLEGTRDFELEEPFSFYMDAENDYVVIRVPKGFITDFGSVPRALWSFIDPIDPDIAKACVIHDFGYIDDVGNRGRKFWDSCLLEGMKVLKAPLWKRSLIYLTVRSVGGFYWDKRRKEERFW